MRPFAQTFQLLLRSKYSINLLMTGLYQNIYELQNNQSLTFLYRAPKINLEPLSISAVAMKYQDFFNINDEKSLELAILTKGYAYAYQVLGYLLYENKKCEVDRLLLSKYDQYLQEYVYDKIWIELSEKDKVVLLAFANNEKAKVEALIKKRRWTKKHSQFIEID